MRTRILVTLVSILTGLALAGCGGGTQAPATGGEKEATSAPPVQEATLAAAPTEAPEPTAEAALGSRANPIPIGTPVEIGSWEVAVTQVNPDAADIVAAENEFNDAPAPGQSFVMIGLSGVYRGEESGTFWTDVSAKVLGNGGNTYSDRCGVIPNDISDAGETFAGASIEGSLCFKVDTAQLDGALLILEEFLSFNDDSRKFFALQ